MRGKVLSLVAAAALLASVGAANAPADAKGRVTLTDNQLDKVTAGATAGRINDPNWKANAMNSRCTALNPV